jgi:hypothetical protein
MNAETTPETTEAPAADPVKVRLIVRLYAGDLLVAETDDRDTWIRALGVAVRDAQPEPQP